MSVLEPTAVLLRWRSEADSFDRFGQEAQARMLRRCAADIEEWWASRDRELVTTDEAIAISGYSRSALEQMRRDGKLTSAGEPGRPLYVAGELPTKPARLETGEPDLAAMVLASRERAS